MSELCFPVPFEESRVPAGIDKAKCMDAITTDVSNISGNTQVRKYVHELEGSLGMLSKEVIGGGMCRTAC